MESEYVYYALIVTGIAFFISVFIARWVFRIDDIVSNLEKINQKLDADSQRLIKDMES
ncbi:hypothetical protein [Chitinophaga agri]|uniref:Uncharacterized protein n=1 Tax=Chitinophaga agri TaxID=2703787 RepID=A0A6B9ZHY9_9BACT|nr:hypothetical protein [Chitinophaga agri]QHS61379.1 hypothetical protein GWR21_17770 [Chitinophaga agri]